MNNKLIEHILNEVSLDERISDGMFNIEENSHMEALRDYFTKKGMNESDVVSFSNRVLEGKYPERQAYNAKGILVTFPTPEYKTNAIKKGTHFEKNPMAKAQNVFQHSPNSESPPPTSSVPSNDEKSNKETSKTNLPISQASPPSSDSTDETEPVQASTTAAPQQTPTPTITTEPIKEPTKLPSPPEKSHSEKEMDKNVIKSMLKGDDYMLEQAAIHIMYNGAPYLIELIKNKL